jgi:hypothetical protein
MGPLLYDRVKETTTTTGTGTITLAGAVSGFRSFSVVGNGNTCFYTLVSGTDWEVGIGTYTASGTTLARTTVLASSAGGTTKITLAGTSDVFLTNPADFAAQYLHPTNAFASLAAAQAGRILLPSDGMAAYRDDGSNLVPWGPLFPFTAPVDGDFAWINQGTATVAAGKGGIFLADETAGGAAFSTRLRKKAAPSPPYTITAALSVNFGCTTNSGFAFAGLAWRQSSDGKLVRFGVEQYGAATSAALAVAKFTSATVFSASYVSAVNSPIYRPFTFLRLVDDNTNRKCQISSDGQNWLTVHSVGRTDFMTADEVGYFVDPYNDIVGVTLHSWKQE